MLGTGLPGPGSGTRHVLRLGYAQPCSLLGSPVLLMGGTGFWGGTAPLCTKSTDRGGEGSRARAAVSYRTASYRNLSKHHRQPELLLWAKHRPAAEACSVPF